MTERGRQLAHDGAAWFRATWTEALARRRLLRLLADTGWPVLTGLLLVFALFALLPATSAVAIGILVERLVAVVQGQPAADGLGLVLPAVVALAALLLADQLVEALEEPLRFAAAHRVNGGVRRRVRAAALAPEEIDHLEDAHVQNDITLASLGWPGYTVGDAAVGQLSLISRYLGAVLSAAVLARFSWVLAAVLLLAMMMVRAMLRRQWLAMVAAMGAHWIDLRRAEYWGDVAAGAADAKEVRIFGLGRWLVDRRQRHLLAAYREVWHLRRGVMLRQPVVFGITAVAALLALVVPTIAALRQQITPGELATSVRAGLGVFVVGSMGAEALSIEHSRPALDALERLLRRIPGPDRPAPGNGVVPVSDRPPHVRFDRVSFAYPGTDRCVLSDLDLDIQPGEVLAIVGLNGAGKTTVSKLLAGLYRPDSGRILVDDVDLRTVDTDAWRQRLAVVFQDFIRYELPARDNVSLAATEHADDLAALDAAAARADALPLVRDLPAGWDTPLSRGYPGGTDLSGGQWQRVALTRALFALRNGGRLLVLDEPTAHLDVRAELAVFNHVIAAAAGVSVVLISHRFSTVRQANRIVLLNDGKIVEAGTHDALMRLGGRYAELFTLQAARFR